MREGKKKKKNNRRKGARITITIKLKKPPVSPRNETKRKWRERVIPDFPFPKDGGERRLRDSNPIRNNGRVGNREWMKVVQRFEQLSLR